MLCGDYPMTAYDFKTKQTINLGAIARKNMHGVVLAHARAAGICQQGISLLNVTDEVKK